MPLLEAVTQATLLILNIVGAIVFVVILAGIIILGYFIGDDHNLGWLGTIIGIVLAFWLLSVAMLY